MKKLTGLLVGAALMMAAGSSWATPITFTPNVSGSFLTLSEYAPRGDLNPTLILSDSPFLLIDNATQSLDFFKLTASGLALNANYNISAKLAFSAPLVEAIGVGNGKFSTFFGLLTANTLTWDKSTLPDYFTLQDGNKFSIDFEDIKVFGPGNTITVHAFVKNYGGAAPVPEPGTMVLLGAGLLGLAIFGKRRMNNKEA